MLSIRVLHEGREGRSYDHFKTVSFRKIIGGKDCELFGRLVQTVPDALQVKEDIRDHLFKRLVGVAVQELNQKFGGSSGVPNLTYIRVLHEGREGRSYDHFKTVSFRKIIGGKDCELFGRLVQTVPDALQVKEDIRDHLFKRLVGVAVQELNQKFGGSSGVLLLVFLGHVLKGLRKLGDVDFDPLHSYLNQFFRIIVFEF